MNVDKMRHQLRRAEAHALGTRVHDGPWTTTALEGPLAAINREIQRIAAASRTPGLAQARWRGASDVWMLIDETAAWRDKVAAREAEYAPAWRAALEAAAELGTDGWQPAPGWSIHSACLRTHTVVEGIVCSHDGGPVDECPRTGARMCRTCYSTDWRRA